MADKEESFQQAEVIEPETGTKAPAKSGDAGAADLPHRFEEDAPDHSAHPEGHDIIVWLLWGAAFLILLFEMF